MASTGDALRLLYLILMSRNRCEISVSSNIIYEIILFMVGLETDMSFWCCSIGKLSLLVSGGSVIKFIRLLDVCYVTFTGKVLTLR